MDIVSVSHIYLYIYTCGRVNVSCKKDLYQN